MAKWISLGGIGKWLPANAAAKASKLAEEIKTAIDAGTVFVSEVLAEAKQTEDAVKTSVKKAKDTIKKAKKKATEEVKEEKEKSDA